LTLVPLASPWLPRQAPGPGSGARLRGRNLGCFPAAPRAPVPSRLHRSRDRLDAARASAV